MDTRGRRGGRAAGPVNQQTPPRPPLSAAPFPGEDAAASGIVPSVAAPTGPAAPVGAEEAVDSEAAQRIIPSEPGPAGPDLNEPLAAGLPEAVAQSVSPPAMTLPIAAEAAERPAQTRSGAAAAPAALRQGFDRLSEEFVAYLRRSVDNAARTSIDMLGVKTWSDVIAVNSKFAHACFDLWIDSSARISELGIKLALESSKTLQRQ
jgi:hypothetical protein